MSAEQAVPVKGREEPAAVTPPTLPPPEGKLRLKPLDRPTGRPAGHRPRSVGGGGSPGARPLGWAGVAGFEPLRRGDGRGGGPTRARPIRPPRADRPLVVGPQSRGAGGASLG